MTEWATVQNEMNHNMKVKWPDRKTKWTQGKKYQNEKHNTKLKNNKETKSKGLQCTTNLPQCKTKWYTAQNKIIVT